MWIRTAITGAIPLVVVLPRVLLPPMPVEARVLFYVALGAIVNYFVATRAVYAVPLRIAETERHGVVSRLTITTRRGDLTATTHTDMADFLRDAITTPRRKRFPLLRHIPTDLIDREMQQHVWSRFVFHVVVFSGLAWVWAFILLRP